HSASIAATSAAVAAWKMRSRSGAAAGPVAESQPASIARPINTERKWGCRSTSFVRRESGGPSLAGPAPVVARGRPGAGEPGRLSTTSLHLIFQHTRRILHPEPEPMSILPEG